MSFVALFFPTSATSLQCGVFQLRVLFLSQRGIGCLKDTEIAFSYVLTSLISSLTSKHKWMMVK